ncbi:MAG: ROK family protein [Planctomycetes bacterium]|nr:ROK family protein [Planctomycetota bacterium]
MKSVVEYALGIDIGGTNISAGLIDLQGRIHLKKSIPSYAQKGGPAVLRKANQLAQTILARSDNVLGVGVGVPGQIDPGRGMPLSPTPNIPKWSHLPVKSVIARSTGLPVFIENDANVAALGEMYFGAGKTAVSPALMRDKGVKNLVCLTLGTGIGGGIIIDGKIYSGSFYYAGEIGHITILPTPRLRQTSDPNVVRCKCGNYGCLETIASASGVVRRFLSACHSRAGGNPVTAKQIFDNAKKGIQPYKDIALETGFYLGIACASIINILDLDLVVIGGKMSEAGPILFNQIRKTFRKRIMQSAAKQPNVVPAKLGGDAGLIGAGVLVFQKLGYL